MVEEGQLRDMGGWRVGVFMRGTEEQTWIANDNRFITETPMFGADRRHGQPLTQSPTAPILPLSTPPLFLHAH